jgi:mycobactin peptide synthetase MbtE
MSAFTTLADYLEHSAERAPDRPALVDPSGRTLTYRELDEAANRVAHWLAACGVGKGDRVGLCLPKSAESVAGIYGALKLGARRAQSLHFFRLPGQGRDH